MGRRPIETRQNWAKSLVQFAPKRKPEPFLTWLYTCMHSGSWVEPNDVGSNGANSDSDNSDSAKPGSDWEIEPSVIGEPPHGWLDPWLLGTVHEQAVSTTERKKRGAWYTPATVVRGLVRLAFADRAKSLDRSGKDDWVVVDPTCGGGAFLLAAADYLVEEGIRPIDALWRVRGQDVDPLAVTVTERSLQIWALCHGVDESDASEAISISCGDALRSWPVEEGSLQLVVGNPPFATPLRSGALPAAAKKFGTANDDVLGPYADLAAMHLLRATRAAGSGSVVQLVQPQSLLAGRDTRALREHLESVAPLVGLWVAREAVFDAGVRTCAPKLLVADTSKGASVGTAKSSMIESTMAGDVRLASGPEVAQRGKVKAPVSDLATPGSHRLSCLAADALGAPPLPPMRGQLAELGVEATAGFRDEYYGLAAGCREAAGGDQSKELPLITVGLIEPLENCWGTAVARLAGKRWHRPVVTLEDLEPKVASWTQRQLKPKLLVATQAKILEPVVDRSGHLVPLTPVVAVHCDLAELERVAAVLLAPPVVAWAWRRWFGSALSVDGVKLSAKQLATLPLPADRQKWDAAAQIIAEGCDLPAQSDLLQEVATLMTEAYGADEEVLQWWTGRRKGSRAKSRLPKEVRS